MRCMSIKEFLDKYQRTVNGTAIMFMAVHAPLDEDTAILMAIEALAADKDIEIWDLDDVDNFDFKI